MARKSPVQRIALSVAPAVIAVALVLVPAALADKGGGGGNGGGKATAGGGTTAPSTTSASGGSGPAANSTCGSMPRAAVTNTWAWGASGSWGLPGQQVAYHIIVFNDDISCGSSTFAVNVSAPAGFSVSVPQSTITLGSASSGYLWAYVTSPSGAADGDYPVDLSTTRAGTATPAGTSTSSYKVYSSDSAAPKLYYPNPWDGAAVSGRSYNIGVASSDDHAVKKIDLYLDGVYKSTSSCDNVSSECRLSYSWAIRRVHGQHTVTFQSSDWMGNVGTLTTTFTVN